MAIARSYDINRKCCLTCQYYDRDRTINVIVNRYCIEYDNAYGIHGTCSMRNGQVMPHDHPAVNAAHCVYRRWIELP